MPHVITQSCCNDASCISVCPVNCIHPTPDEPGFATAEMLYIDPATCIDCGACIDECPVSAISPDDQLGNKGQRYLQINADYYTDHPVHHRPAPPPKRPPVPHHTELHIAIVGAGPAAFYAAEELLHHRGVRVDMYDRLPTPYGLVRAGVAPDHPSTKGVERTFAATANKAGFEYYLNVEVGKHITHHELLQHYSAVIYAVGASTDKRLRIPGEYLPGSIPATDFVAWYNGHPDYADLEVDLSCPRAVIVGNGNVALDAARMLLTDSDVLGRTDIADHALEQLRSSKVTEVVLLGRRGIAQAAYTNAEFLAMGDIDGVDVVIDPDELTLDAASEQGLADGTLDSTVAGKIRIAREFAERGGNEANKRVVFRYLVSPVALTGQESVSAITCVRNELKAGGSVTVAATDERFTIDTTLVMRAIGYHGIPIDDLPFDDSRGVVPNANSRVLTAPDADPVPGVYVTGWIKRGATGGIGMNRLDGQHTARAVLDDYTRGILPQPTATREMIAPLIAERGANRIAADGWHRIDDAEKSAGRTQGRRRVKLVRVQDFEDVAAAPHNT